MTIEDNLNERSMQLYENLVANGYKIELKVDPSLDNELEDGIWGLIPYYAIVTKHNAPSPEGFAHEMLHINLFNQGFQSAQSLYKKVNENIYIFNPEFLEVTNNNIAHYKMVQSFQNFGFDRNNFFGTTTNQQLEFATRELSEIKAKPENERFQTYVNVYSNMRLLRDYFDLNTNGLREALIDLDNYLFNACDEVFNEWVNQSDANNLIFYLSLKNKLLTIR